MVDPIHANTHTHTHTHTPLFVLNKFRPAYTSGRESIMVTQKLR